MKKIFRKNQLIITTLAVMIAVAGYLNYSGEQFGKKKDTAQADGKAVVEDDIVNTGDISTEDIYARTQQVLAEDVVQQSTQDDVSGEAAQTSAGLEDIEALPEIEASADETPSNPGSAVLANSSEVGAVAQARLTREQTRAKNKEILMDIINNTALAEAQKQDAVQEMMDLTAVAEKEAAAEILLEAKGFAQAVVSLQENSVDVVIRATELTDAQRAQIEDIVKRKTGISGENIIITPVQ